MVDISKKAITSRRARAAGTVYLKESTLEAISEGRVAKGDPLSAAKIAGILAAKRCDELIPLCHSIPLDKVDIKLRCCADPARIEIESEVSCHAGTGAEMEALVAVSVAALTVYDMVKAADREAVIGDIRLLAKSGGKSGTYAREEAK
jgi:cyclic pyranopterin phosphate synthase